MKKSKTENSPLPAVHIVQKELLEPYNPVTVNLIGVGGTGSQVLTALARMSQALNGLGHPGLKVTLFDDDTVQTPNLDKTHQNDPYRPIQKGPLCQLKVTTFAKAK